MYYIAKATCEGEVIGPMYPQCQKFIKEYDPDVEGGIYWLYDQVIWKKMC